MTAFTPDAAAALPGPDWLRAARTAAAERAATTPMPTDAEEIWRYSRIGEVDLDAYTPASAASAATSELASSLSTAVGVGEGASLLPLLDRDGVLGEVAGEHDLFSTLNAAFTIDPVLIEVPKGKALEAPVVITHVMGGHGEARFPRTIIRAGEQSELSVVEVFIGGEGAGLVCPVLEIDVADGANVRYTAVQLLGPEITSIAYQGSRIGRDASLVSGTVALGGKYARTRTDSRLVAQGGSANLLAVYFGAVDQMHDFRTLQHHEAGRTTSDLVFKGAVADRSHSVYSGMIKILNGARGADARQSNRNLVLSEGAHADSVPNLEIEENDVRCAHASSVGPVDEEQRYYLATRGIPPVVADRLIVLGFLSDVLDHLPAPGLRAPLRAAIAAKLDATEAIR